MRGRWPEWTFGPLLMIFILIFVATLAGMIVGVALIFTYSIWVGNLVTLGSIALLFGEAWLWEEVIDS